MIAAGQHGSWLPQSQADASRQSTDALLAAAAAITAEWTCAARGLVPAGSAVVDVHCHVGVDSDGSSIDAEELVAQLDAAEIAHATVIALHQAGGYVEENSGVLEVAAASGGRLVALHRIDPALGDGVEADARGALAAGARGLKWHPRAETFSMQSHAATTSARVAGEARVPILIHAGRGMPQLGAGVIDLARAHPEAAFVLAHSAVSDMSWILDAARDLPNVVFDTSWWRPWDVSVLLARAEPGRLVHGSDPPYGTVAMGLQLTARIARACGFDDVAMRSLMGGAAGELLRIEGATGAVGRGDGWGPRALPEEDPDLRRAASYLEAAVQLAIAQADPAEALDLGVHALQVPDSHEHAEAAAVLRAAMITAGELLARRDEVRPPGPMLALPEHVCAGMILLICTLVHASTPAIPVAGVELLQ